MKYAVLSSKVSEECKSKLRELGYTPLLLPPFARLSHPVDTHADMLFFTLGKNIITHREYYACAKDVFDVLCSECGVELLLCDADVGDKYPEDIAYNALAAEGVLFSKTKHTSPLILALARECGLSLSDVAQGYTACSTLSLGSGQVICADTSLSAEYENHGITVTRITNGSVKLEPYEYGFIGGCSGVDGDTVFFAGDLDTHSDADLIKKAIAKNGMKAVSLADGVLYDVGGIKFFESEK